MTVRVRELARIPTGHAGVDRALDQMRAVLNPFLRAVGAGDATELPTLAPSPAGAFGAPARSVTVTVDEKGRVRAASDAPIAIGQTQVTGLPGALAAKEDTAKRGAPNGYAPLGADGRVPAANLPASLSGRREVLAIDAVADVPTARVVGQCWLDASARPGASYALEAVGAVSAAGAVMQVVLFNLAAGTAVATLTFDSTTPARKTSGALALGSPPAAYELRIRLSAGAAPAFGFLGSAALLVG